jgi:hypothetical protein
MEEMMSRRALPEGIDRFEVICPGIRHRWHDDRIRLTATNDQRYSD